MGDLYHNSPFDRYEVQERKMLRLQQEIAAMEEKLDENVALRRQLENQELTEHERTQRVIDKMNSRNMLLKEEIDRFNSSRSPVNSPPPKKLVSDIMSQRTKEFSIQQHEKALHYKHLMAEKQRLQLAQDKLREKRLALHRLPTANDGGQRVPRPPSMESALSNGVVVHQAAMDMPYTVGRIWSLKEDLRGEFERKRKPYRGELGVESYQAWQIEDYVWIRKFVEGFLDDFVNKYIPSDYGYPGTGVRLDLQRADDVHWQRTAAAVSQRKAVQLVAEALLLQETRALMHQVAAEVLHIRGTFRNLTDKLMMREAEAISTGKDGERSKEDPAYNLVTRAYFAAQENRVKLRHDVWSHSQPLQLKENKLATPSSPDQQEIDRDVDVDLITHGHLHPTDLQKFKVTSFDLLQTRKKKECTSRYRKKEAEFWKGMEPGLFSLQVPASCRGVQCMQPSADGNYMAVGTVNGDVLVYDIQWEPWYLGRVGPASKAGQSTLNLAWTLDGTRLTSLHQGGRVEVWTMEGPALNRRLMDVPADKYGSLPKQLGRLATLDASKEDFIFHSGAMAESKVITGRVGPTQVKFFPSFSFFGVQHSVCCALDNADVMKVNLEVKSASDVTRIGRQELVYPEAPCIYQENIYDEEHGASIVGQDLEAELFRQHKHPILHLGFIDHISRMVTVDDQGFISIWNYDPSFISGFSYFIPEKKYRLELQKKMYTPSKADKAKVIFSDYEASKSKSRAEVTKDRKDIQRQLEKMNLGDPWHEEILTDKNLVTSVYAPRGGVKDSGAMFHLVIRYEKTAQICSYLTRMYRPVKVKCSKLMSVQQTPSGRELVFVLLFPEYPPKEPHLMILVLDLTTMKLRDIRRDVHLSKQEHDRILQSPVLSFSSTRVLSVTGAEYLMILMEGRLRCVSLATGNLVLRVEDPNYPTGFVGCVVDEKYLSVARTAQVTASSFNGCIYAAIYDKASTGIQILKLEDNNTAEDRRIMFKSYQMCESSRAAPPETSVNRTQWELGDLQHSQVEMRKLLLELVDSVLFPAPRQDPAVQSARDLAHKTELYHALQSKVDNQRLLEDPQAPANRR